MEKHNTKLGIENKEETKKEFKEILDQMIRIGKGQEYSKKFCNLLLHQGPKDKNRNLIFQVPEDHNKILDILQESIFLEEEDIKQHLLLSIWKYRLNNIRTIKKAFFYILRDYILSQKVFIHETNWQNDYSQYIEDVTYCNEISRKNTNINIDIFKKINNYKLSPYHQFLLYCIYGLDFNEKTLYKLTLNTIKMFEFDVINLHKLIKELFNGNKDIESRRNCKK